jgi:hypothetical protein
MEITIKTVKITQLKNTSKNYGVFGDNIAKPMHSI